MQAETTVEKILHLIDYDGNKVGVFRWAPDGISSSQATDPANQTDLDALLTTLQTSKLYSRWGELTKDESGRVIGCVTYQIHCPVKNPLFLDTIRENLYQFPFGNRILMGLPEGHPALQNTT